MLTFLVIFPVLGAILVATLPKDEERYAKYMALAVTGIVLAVSLVVFGMFDTGDAGLQFTESFRWIRAEDAGFDVQYFLGVDGLGLTMVILTTLLFTVGVLISWKVELRSKEYFAWLLALETGVLGVFMAQDLILFFFFWEVELLPMYLLISIWGSGRKEYSAMKFLLFTLGGSALMLVAAALASSVTDNIPIAATLAKILAAHPEIGGDPASPFWWAVIFGANLGGNLTPIGSASTLVAITIIHKHGLPLSFGGFVAKALVFALMQLAIALVYVLFVLPLFG